MRYLILVRHSISQPRKDISSHAWQLTPEGRHKCSILADRLRCFNIVQVFSSDEPKAVETAKLLSENLNVASQPLHNPGLRETARKTAPFFADHSQFQQAIQNAMNTPTELRYGEESFADALARFSAAVGTIIDTGSETVALVSHGTILSLYIAHHTGLDAFTLWQKWDMPAYAVFALPDMAIQEICFALPSDKHS